MQHALDHEFWMSENSAIVLEINATDNDGDTLSIHLTGGEDAGLFSVETLSDHNMSLDRIVFDGTPDFEDPIDADSNNTYTVYFRVVDGHGGYDEKRLTIRVTDVFENNGPKFVMDSNISVPENETFITELNASDPDGDELTFSISYGDDADVFDINQSTGELVFRVPPNFEDPADDDLDNIYELTLGVSDGYDSDYLNLRVVVLDVFENNGPEFVMDSNISVPENETFITELNASDPDGDELTFSISYGDDADIFDINQSTGELIFRVPPNFEDPADDDLNNIYEVTLGVSDGYESDYISLWVNVLGIYENQAPSFRTNGKIQAFENDFYVFEFNASDPDGDQLMYSILHGDDAAFFGINSINGLLSFVTAQDFESPNDKNEDNLYELTVGVSDGEFQSFINLEVTLNDVYEDDGNYTGGEDGDGNESEFWGHPIFNFPASTLQNLTGESLLPGYYAVVETGPYFVDLEPVILESNGSWLPTTESDYVNMVPGYYSDAHNLWQNLQSLMDEPVGFLSGVHHDDNETLPSDHNESELGAFDIMLSNNRVFENEEPGTLVGYIEVIPLSEVNNSTGDEFDLYSAINFELLFGQDYFQLDDGMLFTNAYLDYEESSEQMIIIGAADPNGFIMEYEFIIEVEDRFQPIVRSTRAASVDTDSAWLGGQLLDGGGESRYLEKGVLLSNHPRPDIHDKDTIIFVSDGNQTNEFFEVYVENLLSENTYFYRAYAKNDEGIAYGATYRFTTQAIPISPDWTDAEPIESAEGWWNSPWFGAFFVSEDESWILHEGLGWLFLLPQEEGIWMWQEELGWLWTEESIYPYFYSLEMDWIFYHGSSSRSSLFYGFRDERWLAVPK